MFVGTFWNAIVLGVFNGYDAVRCMNALLREICYGVEFSYCLISELF